MQPKDNVPRFRAIDVPVQSGPPPLDEGRGTIWECDAFHKTARQAADEFAATFWDVMCYPEEVPAEEVKDRSQTEQTGL